MSKPIQLKHLAPFKQENNSFFAGACSKCSHRKTCKKPCFFVKEYLKFDNRKPFEENEGNFLTIIRPGSKREIRTCELNTDEDSGEFFGGTQLFFSTDNASPFASAIDNPKLKQTGIFIDRFFFKMGYKELAEKYDTTKSGVSKLYDNAKSRIVKTVEAMDRADLALANGDPIVKMKRAVQAFLLHTLFGLSVTEISKFMGVSHTLIVRNLAATRDQIITGEINLFNFTEENREAAQERLESVRAKRRGYDKNRKRPPRKKKCSGIQV